MPYSAMKEIWEKSYEVNGWRESHGNPLLIWWWLLWLFTNVVGRVVERMYREAESIEELIRANILFFPAYALSVLLAFVFLRLMNDIYVAQMTCAKKKELVS